ncbi:hypothetical protein NAT51_12825 [Flavobacterium amniphilum]|uniref:hypothetical protein n=1 Tax=Flavobacterium amniphilum TaxID=1834035 RepID=UPI00202A2BF2|nr:hypothetical protein [Flavobacterium amniphilum]MCL9805826.1 hypothetical protein [Flavobacterium amniphilum]MCL9806413.1 hypothetical protein [Flavobacterium amniphilum]
MNEYILKLPYEFEAFQLGIELTIIHYVDEENFTKKNDDELEVIVYNIAFDDEDNMYSFDKDIRASAPYIFNEN